MTRRFAPLAFLPLLLGVNTCTPTPAEPTWFSTCGDPVCQGYSGPTSVPLCTDETLGDACDPEGATCDPENDCNALMICATEDPTAEPGGCPISRRRYKRDIAYLSDAEVAAVADGALGMKLATWHYTWDAPDAPAHLGFVIDDAPHSYGVTADGDHVDLYGYTSLALATAQAQQAHIESLEARLAAQDARIARLEAALARR